MKTIVFYSKFHWSWFLINKQSQLIQVMAWCPIIQVMTWCWKYVQAITCINDDHSKWQYMGHKVSVHYCKYLLFSAFMKKYDTCSLLDIITPAYQYTKYAFFFILWNDCYLEWLLFWNSQYMVQSKLMWNSPMLLSSFLQWYGTLLKS